MFHAAFPPILGSLTRYKDYLVFGIATIPIIDEIESGKIRKRFFFEKKKQKTSAKLDRAGGNTHGPN
jgi:hypothetical protein